MFETFYILNEGFLENLVSPGRPEKLYEKMYVLVPMTYECKTHVKCKTEKKHVTQINSNKVKKNFDLQYVEQTQNILPVIHNFVCPYNHLVSVVIPTKHLHIKTSRSFRIKFSIE